MYISKEKNCFSFLLPQPVSRQHFLKFHEYIWEEKRESLSDAGAVAVHSHITLFSLPYKLPQGFFMLLLQSWQNVGQGLTLLHWHWKRLVFFSGRVLEK